MATAERRKYTVAEYLAAEAIAQQKHDYYQGDIYAMSGGSPAHNRIVSNIHWRLAQQLDGHPCLPNSSDVLVNANSLYSYPDVSVVCPPIKREAGPIETLLNPHVLIEVLSSSTERYDRNVKFLHYQQMPSVQEILLVQQDAPRVEHYVRSDNGAWILNTATRLDETVRLQSIACELPLVQVYAHVEFPAAPFEIVLPPFPPYAKG